MLKLPLFINPFMPNGACLSCPRDCVSRHNGGTLGAPLKPLRDDSALRTLSSLRGLRGAPKLPPLCRETQSLGQHMLELSCKNATVDTNGLTSVLGTMVSGASRGSGGVSWTTVSGGLLGMAFSGAVSGSTFYICYYSDLELCCPKIAKVNVNELDTKQSNVIIILFNIVH